MVFRAFFDYIRSSISELQKVNWPTRREVITYTLIILVSIAIAVLIVSAIDYGLSQLVNRFLI